MFKFRLTNDLQYIQLIEHDSEADLKYLKNYFRRQSENFYFDPSYKNKTWDGFHHYFDNGFIPVGLWLELHNFLKTNNYSIVIDGLEKLVLANVKEQNIKDWCDYIFAGLDKIVPRAYQIEASYKVIKYRYCGAEMATASGKTIISFIIFTYLKNKGLISPDRKMLLLVNRAQLIKQTVEKFIGDYDNGSLKYNVMGIGGEYKYSQKKFDKAFAEADIIIGTYQSVINKDVNFFSKIKFINVDEAHTVLNNSVRDIIERCTPLLYRFGLSGTLELNKKKSEYFRTQKYLGPIVTVYSADQLQKDGYAPKVYVKVLNLDYTNHNDKLLNDYLYFRENGKEFYASNDAFATDLYKIEKSIIIGSDARLKFICDLITGMKMNTLVLFNNVKDQYGKSIYDELQKRECESYYIDGLTKGKSREEYTDLVEKSDNIKLIASYGTFSTGIDLKNIYNIIFVESFKSEILIRQSIGRGMRDLAGKHSINIIDIVDTLFKYSIKHSKERISIYKDQKFKMEYLDHKLFKTGLPFPV